jgi:hypothetical protein
MKRPIVAGAGAGLGVDVTVEVAEMSASLALAVGTVSSELILPLSLFALDTPSKQLLIIHYS